MIDNQAYLSQGLPSGMGVNDAYGLGELRTSREEGVYEIPTDGGSYHGDDYMPVYPASGEEIEAQTTKLDEEREQTQHIYEDLPF